MPGGDPFKDAGRGDPFKDAGRGGGESAYGGGLGWAVVAFMGPVGLDISQLAARMLSGTRPQGPNGDNPGSKALGDAAMRAQAAWRKRAQEIEKLKADSKAYVESKAYKESRERRGGSKRPPKK